MANLNLILLENTKQLREGDLFYVSEDHFSPPFVAEVEPHRSADIGFDDAYVAYGTPSFGASCILKRALVLRPTREGLEILAGKEIYDTLIVAQKRALESPLIAVAQGAVGRLHQTEQALDGLKEEL